MKLKIVDKKVTLNEKAKVVTTVITDEFGNRFKGKARCSEQDTFNPDFGTKLSYFRAKSKMFDSYYREYNQNIKLADARKLRLVSICNKFGKTREKVMDDIKKLLG